MIIRVANESSSESLDAVDRAERVQEIVDDCLARRMAGEEISDESIIVNNADLLPELGAALRHVQLVQAAERNDAVSYENGSPRDASVADSSLTVRCPHCHTPTPLVADASLSSLTCSACGNGFSLIDETADELPLSGPFGHFEILRHLGSGGFGAVYQARDTQLDRVVALKIPRRGQLTAAEADQFLREARTTAQLRHPHIVSVYEVGRHADTLYIASEFIDGESLAARLAREPLTAREAATLCQKLASALEHAHSVGVVHRDLKPANVLLDHSGEPHITDFGLARCEAGEVTLTMDGVVVGTPAYMSPEQARGQSHTADRRSDVYSLGVILFELLTGELPFRGNIRMVTEQILNEEPPSPRKLNATVPRDLETITLKCLEKDPARRYATAKDLANDLGRFSRGEPIHARPVSRIERTWRWCRRNPRIAGLSATVAALLLVVATVTTYSSIHSRAAAREARWQQYLSDMHVAMNAWEDAKIGKVIEVLEQHRPVAGEEDFRSFEWYYLWRQATSALELPGLKLDSSATAVTGSPDGQILATGEENGQLSLWCLSDLTLLGKLQAHRFRVEQIRFSEDGRTIATGGDHSVRIWDVASQRMLHSLDGHREQMFCISFSPDGSRLTSSSSDRTAKLWDLSTGAELCTLWGHGDTVSHVSWLDDARLLTVARDHTVREWDAATGNQLRVVTTLAVQPYRSFLSPDRALLACAGIDNTVRLFDARTGELRDAFAGNRVSVRSIRFSADSKSLATVGGDGKALVWDIASSALRHSIAAHSGELTRVAFTPDGATLVTASQDGSVKLHQIGTKKFGEDLVLSGHTNYVLKLAFDARGRRLASTSADGTVRIWNAQTGEIERVLEHKPAADGAGEELLNREWMQFVVWSPRDSTVFASGGDGSVSAWNSDTGDLLWTLSAHSDRACVDCSPDGEILASGGAGDKDKAVRLWRALDGRAMGQFVLEGSALNSVKFSPDGDLLACGDDAGRLIILNAKTGSKKQVLGDHRGSIGSIAFSHQGQIVATGGGAPGAILWHLSSGRQLHALAHGEHVNGVAFSPDDRVLATAGFDNVVRLWDVASGAERIALKGHAAWASDVAFAPVGRVLASCSDDRTIRLWRAANRDEANTAGPQ